MQLFTKQNIYKFYKDTLLKPQLFNKDNFYETETIIKQTLTK